jgi:hemolysin activation/secretion protein
MKPQKHRLGAIFIAIAFLNISSAVFAQTQSSDAINQQDWIIRNQQNILEETKRSKEMEAISKDFERKKKEEEEEKDQQLKVIKKSEECWQINEIKLSGASKISARKQKNLLQKFLGRCFDAKNLQEIITTLNEFYQAQGYVTTQIIVPKQNISSGIFELKIIEGKIEKIIFGKETWREKMQKFMAFGSKQGKVLDLNEINDGIYQINRLPSNSAVIKIEPGSVDGMSKIVIENNKKFPLRATVGKDNLGNKFTGVQRAVFSTSFDNFLSLDDALNLTYSTNAHDDSQVKDIKSFSGGISIPFKQNTFSYDYSHSEFKGQNVGVASTTTLTGFSKQNKFGAQRILLNDSKLRITSTATLTTKESASYLNGEKIETSQRRLSVGNFALAFSSFFPTYSIYLSPSYSRGLKVLDAKKDHKNIDASIPKAQFELFKLYASVTKKVSISDFKFSIGSEFDSQISKDTLFGSEQFAVGGYYSVRGFRENYISGDSGYFLRNKLTFDLGNFNTFSYQSRIKLEPFYDYGHIKIKTGEAGRMSGAGVKTAFESNNFNASFTCAWGVNSSQLVTTNQKENALVYFEIGAGF